MFSKESKPPNTFSIIQYLCTAVVGISCTVSSLIGGVFILTGVLSFLFGQEPAAVMWSMILAGVSLCLLSKTGQWITVQIAYLKLCVKSITT
jgi:hypothetical protein